MSGSVQTASNHVLRAKTSRLTHEHIIRSLGTIVLDYLLSH